MRKLIKKILKLMNYNISRINKKVENLDFDILLKEKIKKKPIIFDVGSNKGSSVERFKRIFNEPLIHAFEPVNSQFNIMYEKFKNDKEVFCNNFALGDKFEEKQINITEKTGKSSFYNVNISEEWKKNKIESSITKTISQQKTKIHTLDEYCNEKKIDSIDLLKIDAQMYEDKILQGSLNSLKSNKIKAIVVEIILNDAYDKYFTFSDIEKNLIPNNFRLIGLDVPSNSLYTKTSFYADVYYFNTNYFDI